MKSINSVISLRNKYSNWDYLICFMYLGRLFIIIGIFLLKYPDASKKYFLQITNQCIPIVCMPGIKTSGMALIISNVKAISRYKQS